MTTIEVPALLCHCADDRDGHAPAAACAAPVKTGKYRRDPLPGSCGVTSYGLTGPPAGTTGATGTCPTCTRTGIKVRRAEVVTSNRRDLHNFPVNIVIAIRPALAPHRTPGRSGTPCEGAGLVPTETRWRATALEAILRDYGPDAVTLR